MPVALPQVGIGAGCVGAGRVCRCRGGCGRPAFGCYLPDEAGGEAAAAGLIVLTIRDDQVRAMTRFLDNGVFALFDLPEAL